MKLVWFRNDLRLADHPALSACCANASPADEVAALFVISAQQWQQYHMAPRRQRFILAQLDELGRELAALGIELHLVRADTFADAPAALAALSQRLGVTDLYAHQAIELDEQRRDRNVAIALTESEVSCHW
ncbi:MAG: deoxyribodipyrimidine photo-lyase, partial [Aeromonas sp.]